MRLLHVLGVKGALVELHLLLLLPLGQALQEGSQDKLKRYEDQTSSEYKLKGSKTWASDREA